eukprot:scaffold135699_cov163-Phaeocystis_antarctica.AAC.1
MCAESARPSSAASQVSAKGSPDGSRSTRRSPWLGLELGLELELGLGLGPSPIWGARGRRGVGTQAGLAGRAGHTVVAQQCAPALAVRSGAWCEEPCGCGPQRLGAGHRPQQAAPCSLVKSCVGCAHHPQLAQS